MNSLQPISEKNLRIKSPRKQGFQMRIAHSLVYVESWSVSNR